MSESYKDPANSKAQIKAFAYKVQRRLVAAGATGHSIEDLEQELWYAWCLACEAYDPAMGASFKTFLYRGLQHHANRYVEKTVDRRHAEIYALSLDQNMERSYGEGSMTLASVVPSNDLSPLESMECQAFHTFAMEKLSPRTKQFITILKEQPDELLDQIELLEKKSAYAKERGIRFAVARRITTVMIFNLMGASRTERKQIMDELAEVTALAS